MIDAIDVIPSKSFYGLCHHYPHRYHPFIIRAEFLNYQKTTTTLLDML